MVPFQDASVTRLASSPAASRIPSAITTPLRRKAAEPLLRQALECYERIFSVDIDYKDVQERIVSCS